VLGFPWSIAGGMTLASPNRRSPKPRRRPGRLKRFSRPSGVSQRWPPDMGLMRLTRGLRAVIIPRLSANFDAVGELMAYRPGPDVVVVAGVTLSD
jgi:hypothetical protein